MIDPFIIDLTIFILAIFVGYFVVWSVQFVNNKYTHNIS